MKVFSHCELDHFPDGCVGCKGDGKGDCAAVLVDVPPSGPAKWSCTLCWSMLLLGVSWGENCLLIHIGPVCFMRLKA